MDTRFYTPVDILSGKLPKDFGLAKVDGTSMTIPGQGSDLETIIASIVKLPALDERTFDVGVNEEIDETALAMKAELDGMYLAEGKNLADDAKARQNARKEAKKANEEKEKEPATPTPDE